MVASKKAIVVELVVDFKLGIAVVSGPGKNSKLNFDYNKTGLPDLEPTSNYKNPRIVYVYTSRKSALDYPVTYQIVIESLLAVMEPGRGHSAIVFNSCSDNCRNHHNSGSLLMAFTYLYWSFFLLVEHWYFQLMEQLEMLGNSISYIGSVVFE